MNSTNLGKITKSLRQKKWDEKQWENITKFVMIDEIVYTLSPSRWEKNGNTFFHDLQLADKRATSVQF